MVRVDFACIMCVKIGDHVYYDASNGILRSNTTVHRITVPAEELDKACKYTICYRKVIDRKPYFPEFEDEIECQYEFRPVRAGKIYAYMIADAHNMVDQPIAALKKFENKHRKIHFLILNGDIINHSGEIEFFDNIYMLAERITNGEIPIVFARGNHDMRGMYAEKFEEYIPINNGNTFYSFRLGHIWGLVLDAGEDKSDEHKEYNGTICCHPFRQKETEYIKELIQHADEEYQAEGVQYKIIVCHIPFTFKSKHYKEEIYKEWAKQIKENIKPDIMLCGHQHQLIISEIGGEFDAYGQPCTVVAGSNVIYDQSFAGCGVIFDNDIKIEFTDSDGSIISEIVEE